MNKKILPIRSFIGILFFCVCSPLFAQNQTYSDIDLIHMTEAAIEPNPTLPYGTKFLENFNAPRIIRNLGRVNRLAGDNKTVTHLFQSLAIIFASSHTIEVSIATLAGEAGLTNADWETSHRILASMLSSISLPGLDPLCLFLGYITLRYNLARTVLTKAVSPIRYIAFDVVGTKMTKLIPIEKIFTRGDVLELFNNNRHITYEEKNKNIYVSFITESGKTAIQLNMLRTNEGSLTLTKLQFTEKNASASELHQIMNNVKQLGSDVYYAVKESLRAYQKRHQDGLIESHIKFSLAYAFNSLIPKWADKLTHPIDRLAGIAELPYIKRVHSDEDKLIVRFKGGAIISQGKLKLNCLTQQFTK